MVEKIKVLKDEFLGLMEKDVKQRGVENANIKFHGELADIVKDLADAERLCWEAEYYRTVIEAMDGGDSKAGYGMGYGTGMSGGGTGGGGRRGYGGSPANGGNLMGHSDPVSAIRDMMMTADPDTKMRIRSELGMM